MEKTHQKEVEELEAKYKEMISKLESSESILKDEMRSLRKRVDDLERDKTD